MKALVVYSSKFGNTKRIAGLVGQGLAEHGTVRVLEVGSVVPGDFRDIDLLVLGGPTQAHGLNPEMAEFLEQVGANPPSFVRIAAFDTRLKGPEFLWGSAARAIAVRLEKVGVSLSVPAISFLVTGMKVPKLEAGEEERARDWGFELGVRFASAKAAAS